MYSLNFDDYIKKIREAVAQSVVLLKNENQTLPIRKGEKIALFGRGQIDTYYCGTGSGGMVNIPYLVTIADGLKSQRDIDEELYKIHSDFIEKNPFDKGKGWAQEPFSQKEPLLSQNTVKASAERCDLAVFVLARSAGEDKDAVAESGSYYLSETEKSNLTLICSNFKRVAVLLNVGGIMDMEFIESCAVGAIVYAWHGGVESGNGYADVLCGSVNPSGCLPDTIAKSLDDYPKNFGDLSQVIYDEDIFVGYRYFETFAQNRVLYPFGYGLSYSEFIFENVRLNHSESGVSVTLSVKNIGQLPGKKTVQFYVNAPTDRLGKPRMTLVGFAKTKLLSPNESQELAVSINYRDFTSFDEGQSAFVLEKGVYTFFAGHNVRDTEQIGNIKIEHETVVERCNVALFPKVSFKRLTATIQNGEYEAIYADAPTRQCNKTEIEQKSSAKRTDCGYNFEQLLSGKITTLQFAEDMSDIELIQLSRGEGMCSPKVTAGTAGCYGGVSRPLAERGIPIVCCADGPSGIRMDCGTLALSLPNGTALASTFNTELIEELFSFLSVEMLYHKVDTLLGPGMNIHRHPLCGRNFEYYSEDPLLTGKMASAQLKAMNRHRVTGTIKHFMANNQESGRNTADSVLSARAAREIYLRGFEIAVREGGAKSLMSAYNPINGIQAASNHDLLTTVLRDDWGYDGMVMTDWWATMNKEGGKASKNNTADMISAQNDVYMVCSDSESNSNDDNSERELEKGSLKREYLVRNAVNIINSTVWYNGNDDVEIEVLSPPENKFEVANELGEFIIGDGTFFPIDKIDTTKGITTKLTLRFSDNGTYRFETKLFADAPQLAQLSMTMKVNGMFLDMLTLKGGSEGVFSGEFNMFATRSAYIELFFGETGMKIITFDIKKID